MQHNHHTMNEEHHQHNHNHHGDFKKKFFTSLLLGLPIIILSPVMGYNLPFQFQFPGSEWLVLLLATFLYLYGGQPFLKGAVSELKTKKPGMMTLISLGITVAYVYSVYAFYMNNFSDKNVHIMDFFWELATLIIIMLFGHWIEMKAIGNAGDALKKMAKLLPSTAIKQNKDGSREEIALSEVEIGNILVIKSGDKIPTDGRVIEGETSVDEALVTGESQQIKKKESDQVIGGTVNGSGTILIEVTATGESSYLSQVMNLMTQVQNEKSQAELLSDKVAGYLFYFALIIGIVSFISWISIRQNLDFALERLVTVLVIACPHALGLAIPLVTARSTSLGAQNGLLIKNRESIETAKKIDYIMMDKTGTLTEGNFTVNYYESYTAEYSDNEVLGLFAAIEASSSHPLAIGIIEKAKLEKVKLPLANKINNLPGIGLEGIIHGKQFKIASAAYLDKTGYVYHAEQFKEYARQGNSISYLLSDSEVIGMVAQGDQIKESSKTMIEKLQYLGITPIMLTGDNEEVAQAVANKLGIEKFHAKLKPQDKEKIIQYYQSQGHSVMMVGDGINDAPSLIRSDIGVAIGAGTDVAVESADIILVKSNPYDIIHFLLLSKNTMRKMIQNLWWGAGYNILAVPLAAGILGPFGLILSPAIGAILMSISTIIVAVNAYTLKMSK